MELILVSSGLGSPPDAPVGGVEAHTYDLATHIGERMGRTHYVEHFGESIRLNGVCVHDVGRKTNAFNTSGFIGQSYALASVAARVLRSTEDAVTESKDNVVLHVHETRGNLPTHLLRKRFPSVPLVLTVHGPAPWGATYDNPSESLVRKFSYKVLDISAFRKASRIIAVTDTIRAHLREVGIPDDITCTIRNPIDLDYFSPAKRVDDEAFSQLFAHRGVEPGFILSVGKLTARKRPMHLLEMFSRSKSSRQLVYVGTGEESNALISRTRALGLTQRVIFAGSLPRTLLPYIFASASTFVTASGAEGFPIAVSEAMASGVGVVAPESDQLREVVDEKNGILFDPNDDSALISALRVIDDDVLVRGWKGESRERAERFFAWKSALSKYEDVYRSLAS